jgi:hypothetical protein
VEEAVERDGLPMTFRGWTYSLEDYGRALEAAGLRIEALREPRPAGGDGGAFRRHDQVPLFLSILAGR